MSYTVSNIQASIFVRNAESPNGNLDLASKLKATCRFLDKDPQILPTDTAPEDIPRIISSSNDGSHEIVINKKKIGYIWSVNANSENLEEKIHVFRKKYLPNLLKFVYDKDLNWTINRVGIILNIETDLGENKTAAELIRERYFAQSSNDLFDKPIEMQYQYITRDVIDDLDTNILVAMGQKGSGINLNKSVLVSNFDVNSAPEDMAVADYNKDKIEKYIDRAFKKLKILPRKYFLE